MKTGRLLFLIGDCRGGTVIEYALLAAAIGCGILASLFLMGDGITGILEALGAALEQTAPPPPDAPE